MTNLERRLRKLEAGIVDRRGLVRGTPRRFDFWSDKLNRMYSGEEVDITGLILADLDEMREMEAKERAETSSVICVPGCDAKRTTGVLDGGGAKRTALPPKIGGWIENTRGDGASSL
jgi:hypothetical protein